MTSHTTFSPARTTALVSLAIAFAFAGCKSKSAAPATDDASVNMQVQAHLFSDQNLGGQSIQATVAGGVVTLSGNVSSDTARTTAASDAAQVAGVKTVINNLVVQPAPSTSAQVTAPPPPAVATIPTPAPVKTIKPSASTPQPSYQPAPQPAPIVRNYPAPQPAPQPAPAPPVQAQAPPPPPPPVVHNITLPAGTTLPIRITQTLDSAVSQTGDKFTGAIASDIIVDDMVVLAQGTPVVGHVDQVQDAGHFKGNSLLSISLSAIDRHGERIQIATDSFMKTGEGRGKNSAEKIGGGAAVGAILGGIFGGGKGAAIGAAAGGGVGAGANGVTRGQQVQIPSETVVRFRLTSPIVVHIGSGPHADQGLERRTDQ
jgi:outer membrane biosynthesis protein TonB